MPRKSLSITKENDRRVQKIRSRFIDQFNQLKLINSGDGKMDIEHLGYRVKSDDSTFEMKIKAEKSIDDKEARELIEKFFETFSIKVNVLTLTKVSQEGQQKSNSDDKHNIPNAEKRQFIMAHYMPKRFTVFDYVGYFGNQGYDREALKKTFHSTVHSLIDEGRVKNTGEKKGRIVIYEIIPSPLEEQELFLKHGDSYVENEKLVEG